MKNDVAKYNLTELVQELCLMSRSSSANVLALSLNNS